MLSPKHEAIRQRLRRFLVEELDWRGAPTGLTDETPLLNNALDSLGIVELVELIEGEFGVPVGDDDLTTENFGTVRGLVAFIARPAV